LISRSFLDDAAEWAGDVYDESAGAVGSAAEAVGDAAGAAADWAGDAADAVGEAADWVGDQANAAANWVDEQVGAAGDFISETAGEAASAVGDIVDSARETVEGGIDAVVGTASELAKEVGEFGEDLKKQFGEQIDKALEVAKQIGKDLLPSDIGDLVKSLDDILKGIANPGKAAGGIFGFFEDEPKAPGKPYALLDSEGSVTRGGVEVPGGTGYSEPKFSFTDVSWYRSDEDIVIQAKLNVDCRWEIASEGRGTNLSSANDSSITETSYLTAIHDLETLKNPTVTGGGVTTTFWSEALVARHEQYHCHDYIQKATTFLPQITAWIEQQSISHDPDSDADIKKQVDNLIAQARQKVEDDNRAYLHAGGEARAYGDGAGAYQALIDGIKARAKAEKWKGSKDL
jgi:hypothetical protein